MVILNIFQRYVNSDIENGSYDHNCNFFCLPTHALLLVNFNEKYKGSPIGTVREITVRKITANQAV